MVFRLGGHNCCSLVLSIERIKILLTSHDVPKSCFFFYITHCRDSLIHSLSFYRCCKNAQNANHFILSKQSIFGHDPQLKWSGKWNVKAYLVYKVETKDAFCLRYCVSVFQFEIAFYVIVRSFYCGGAMGTGRF